MEGCLQLYLKQFALTFMEFELKIVWFASVICGFLSGKNGSVFISLISVTTALLLHQIFIGRSYVNSSGSLCSRRGQLVGKCAAGYFCLAGSSQPTPQGPGFSWRFLSGCQWGQACAGLCPAGENLWKCHKCM